MSDPSLWKWQDMPEAELRSKLHTIGIDSRFVFTTVFDQDELDRVYKPTMRAIGPYEHLDIESPTLGYSRVIFKRKTLYQYCLSVCQPDDTDYVDLSLTTFTPYVPPPYCPHSYRCDC